MNSSMGFAESSRQQRLWIAVRTFSVELLHGIHCDATGFLSAFVSTHTIGDNRKSPLAFVFGIACRFPIGIAIFIILSLAAHIAEASHFNPVAYAHQLRFARHSELFFARLRPLSRIKSELGLYRNYAFFRVSANGTSGNPAGLALPPKGEPSSMSSEKRTPTRMLSEKRCFTILAALAVKSSFRGSPDDICHQPLMMISTGALPDIAS